MAKRYFVAICVVVLVGAVWLVNAADQPTGSEKVVKNTGAQHPPSTGSRSNAVTRVDGVSFGSTVPKAFGTIVYDTSTVNAVPNVQGRTFGNQFNSALNVGGTAIGPVQVSGSVTNLTWGVWGNSVATGTWGAFWLTVFGPVSGTAAPVLWSANLGGVGGSNPVLVTWVLSPAVIYSGPSFLVGMLNYNSLTAPPWNGPCPLFDAGTVGGQGHHGMGISWAGGVGVGFSPITSLNAIMRPNGNVLTPVELMNFTIE